MKLLLDSILYDFPPRDFSPEDPAAVLLLNNLRFIHLRDAMHSWLRERPLRPTGAEFQAELSRRVSEFHYSDLKFADPLDDEALALAEQFIRQKLSAADLPIPRSLRDHARELVAANPSFREAAQERLLARDAAARESRQLLSLAGGSQ